MKRIFTIVYSAENPEIDGVEISIHRLIVTDNDNRKEIFNGAGTDFESLVSHGLDILSEKLNFPDNTVI